MSAGKEKTVIVSLSVVLEVDVEVEGTVDKGKAEDAARSKAYEAFPGAIEVDVVNVSEGPVAGCLYKLNTLVKE